MITCTCQRLALLLPILCLSPLAVQAQQPAAPVREQQPPVFKNLKVLSPDVNVIQVMRMFSAGLGVQCGFCHDVGDFASDENPRKQRARQMVVMMKGLASRFPDSGNDFVNSRYLPYPEGKQYITCFTCHQGQTEPKTKAPEEIRRAPEAKDTSTFGVGANPAPPNPNAGRGGGAAQPPKNLRYLPQDTNFVEVMEGLRMSLGVECNFCHVSGDHMEHGHANNFETGEGRWDYGNPKKLIARNMIKMVKDINATLGHADAPLTKLTAGDLPDGGGLVTCYTCHRGNHVPPAQAVQAQSAR
jgi:photosynthetic reaction center cytochrome c subunit